MTNRPLLESLSASPLFITETGAEFFQGAISFLVNHEHSGEFLDSASSGHMSASDDFWDEDAWYADYRPYMVEDGVLKIPVAGVLLNNFPYQLGRWATGYAYIEAAIQRGLDDPEVYGILLVEDSPGGEVAGCFELTDSIYEVRGSKPIRAIAANAAYSAAYSIASAADHITVTRSGGTGSVGVVTAHVDYSKAMEQRGVKVTFFKFGAHKTDGNPYEALSESAAKRIQARIDKLGAVFVSTVARNRAMTEDAVRETEALTYDAEDSVKVGFADMIGTMEDEMSAFMVETDEDEEEPQMTLKAPKTTATTPEGSVDQATHDAAVEAARAEGVAEGTKAGATAEKERMKTILADDAAKARPKAALAMAMRSGDSAETVIEMLGDLPEEKAEAPTAPKGKEKAKGGSPFDQAMGNSGNPNVGANSGSDDDDDEPDHAESILSDFSAMTGKARKTKAA